MLALFSLTLFVSAILLFSVQPMVGKMILPVYGGTPAVWNCCMVFFQAMLLAGYAYSHVTSSWMGPRRQAAIHLLVLLLPFFVLPIAFSGIAPPTELSPSFWLLGQLFLSVGLPFFVISTSAPLLQHWFASIGHKHSSDPYFLYGASNLGSLIALLGYPLLIEPFFPLFRQSNLWTGVYGVLVLLAYVCAGSMWRANKVKLASPSARAENLDLLVDQSHEASVVLLNNGPQSEVTLGRRLHWLACSFVPSSLMLGVTTYITSDIASMPLLWVVPLALYLLTFVLVFARRQLISQAFISRALPFLLLPLVSVLFRELEMKWLLVPIHLLVFFALAMLCHGELAKNRPRTTHLTEFYLWMSIGGVLGGAFNALIAPAIFNSVAEYPLMLVIACLLRPKLKSDDKRFALMDFVWPLGLAVVAGLTVLAVEVMASTNETINFGIVFAVPALICFAFKDRPIRFGLGYGIGMLTFAAYFHHQQGDQLYAKLGFFGVNRVVIDPGNNFHLLIHGRTLHGRQRIFPQRTEEPLAYYHRKGPLGDVFNALDGDSTKDRVAVIGLGVGATAAYAKPGQHFVFFEIDPVVRDIASNPDYFTFLEKCHGEVEVVLGDARIQLAKQPNDQFGLLVIDAFSSDAIPTHLLTQEALQLYLRKLHPNGMMAFNISNNYLDLEPMLARLAAEEQLVCRYRFDLITKAEHAEGMNPSQYLVIARREEDLGSLIGNSEWSQPVIREDLKVWTDDYSNILSLMRW